MTLKATACILYMLAFLGASCLAKEPEEDAFSQRDLQVAIRLQDLRDITLVLEQTEKDNKDRQWGVYYKRWIVNDLDLLVGAEKLAVQIEKEIKRLTTEDQEDPNPDAAPEFRMRAVRLKMESPKIERMLEMVKTLRSAHKKDRAQQDGAEQPATAPESKWEGKEKPKPESEERSQ